MNRLHAAFAVALWVTPLGAGEAFQPDGPEALKLRTADGAVEVSLGAAVLFETLFVDPEPPLGSRLRVRAAVQLRTTAFERFSLTLVPYYGGQELTVIDLYADVMIAPSLKLRLGRFKEPVSEERLRSFTTMPLFERSLVVNLAPARDVGAQVFGQLLDGRAEYALFVGHGTLDRQNGTLNPGGGFDVAGRVDVRPWRSLAAGLGASWGPRDEAIDQLRYLSSGGTPLVMFAPGARAVEDQLRVSANVSALAGPFGARAEVLSSTQTVAAAAAAESRTRAHGLAWYAEARLVVLGGELTAVGARPADGQGVLDGGWGAWLLVARASQLFADPELFERSAVLVDASASRATAGGVGIGVYLSELNKALLSYERTWFAGTGGLRGGAEDAVLGRVQFLW